MLNAHGLVEKQVTVCFINLTSPSLRLVHLSFLFSSCLLSSSSPHFRLAVSHSTVLKQSQGFANPLFGDDTFLASTEIIPAHKNV